MNKPLVSVIVPVYNSSKYIERCLSSILKNDFVKNCQLIIINDNSNDNSNELIEDLFRKYEELKLNVLLLNFSENKGVAVARQIGIEKSDGEYITFIDSDDWIEHDYLEQLYTSAVLNNADLCVCDYYRETGEDSVLQTVEIDGKDPFILDLVSGKQEGWLWNKIFKKELLIENHIRFEKDLNMCEDLLFTVKSSISARKLFHVEKSLYHYNCSNVNSFSKLLTYEKCMDMIKCCSLIEDALYRTSLDGFQIENAILERKAFTKLWVNTHGLSARIEFINLYNKEPLWKAPRISKKSSLFLKICNTPLKYILFLILKIGNR